MKGILLVAVALAMFLTPLAVGLCSVERIRAEYSEAPPPTRGTQTEDGVETVEKMASQVDDLLKWSVGLLSLIGAVAAGAEWRKVRWRRGVILIMSAAAGLLLPSIRAGIVFDKRHAYLISKGAVSPGGSLNDLLSLQYGYLTASFLVVLIAGMVLFASAILSD